MGTKGWSIVAVVGLVLMFTGQADAEEHGAETVNQILQVGGLLMFALGVIAALVVSARNRRTR